MSIVTLGLAQSALSAIELAVRDGKKIDAGVLGSFNAGISHLLLSGREPGTNEVQALHNLLAGVVADVEDEAGVLMPEIAAEATTVEHEAEAEAPVVEHEAETLVHEGEASVEAGVAAVASAAPANLSAEHLFQEQPHDEDDAA